VVSETHKVSYTTLIAAANGLVGVVTMAPAVMIILQTHTSFKRLIEKSNNAIIGLYLQWKVFTFHPKLDNFACFQQPTKYRRNIDATNFPVRKAIVYLPEKDDSIKVALFPGPAQLSTTSSI